uniref:E3 ubiquitin-protein ligase RNF220 n=1 Tax=Denticeps clupeoides TaxID=299321 RepID=A0AAY4BD40_9TELE
MDLHRTTFKMDSSSYLPSPLASPALMVLASTAEAGRDASVPCQPPRPFGVPVSLEKDAHLPFSGGSYTFTSMYHRQGAVPAGFPARDFPASLLHLHPQFAPPNLDCTPLGMLNHSGVGAFRPFSSTPEERDGGAYHSAFTPAKRLKGCLDPEVSPHLRYTDPEGKEFDFIGARVPSCSPMKAAEDAGKKLYSVSGLLSDRDASSSPEQRKERCECLPALSPNPTVTSTLHFTEFICFLFSLCVCTVCVDLYSFVCMCVYVCVCIQRDGVCSGEDGSVDIRREEFVWSDQKRLQMASILRGFKGVGIVSSTSKENHDSDVDLDVDGDDTLDFGKPQYTDTDVIPCSAEDPLETEDKETLRGTVLNGISPNSRVSPEFPRWSSEEIPSTSNVENRPDGSSNKNSNHETISKDSSLTTMDALKNRIRDLEKQLSRGDRYKCLICMDCYTIPLTSIQCWHVHCEECWLRTLGAKKLCPQCNTITSPGDLRRVYL